MLSLIRRALTVPSDHYRRLIWLCVPAAASIAIVEATSFGLLYLLLQAVSDRDLITTGILGTINDQIGIEDESTFLWVMSITVVVLMLLRGIGSIALLWWQTKVLAAAEAESSARLFDGYMRAPYTFHLQTNSARIIRNVVRSNSIVYQMVLLAMVVGITEISVLAMVAAVLTLSSPIVALTAAALMGLSGFVFLKSINSYSRRMGRHNEEMERVVQQQVLESIHGAKILQVLNREDQVIESFRDVRTEWAGYRQAIVFVNQLPRYYLELVLLLGVAGIGLAATLVSDGGDVVASVGILVAAALRMVPSLNKLLSAGNKAQVGRQAVIEITTQLDFLAAQKELLDSEGDPRPITFHDRLEIRGLSFRYEGTEAPALSDIDLTIRHGESIGIVGASGSGKTTLINVLLGLLEPDEGSVAVDGVTLERTDIRAWRDLVGYIPQDIFLADASLRENVALGIARDDIDDERVHDALRLAQLQEFVSTLPDGIDTFTGEQGVRFSGGQRQRIGIARALYDQPSLLLLDEATSALDGVTEEQVAETIESLRGTITMGIIAHRLSTVQRCDRIVLMKGGRIEHEGSFSELASSNAEFADMLRRATPNPSGSN